MARNAGSGALYLLMLSGNQIMYRNIISQIDHPPRLRGVPTSKVLHLARRRPHPYAGRGYRGEHILLVAKTDEQPKGQRADHNALPDDDIMAKFV